MLLRVVADVDAAVPGFMPDPRRRLPGRGAHLHVDPDCLAKAERRRAFSRALRVTGILDTEALTAYIAAHANGADRAAGTTDGGITPPGPARTTDMSTR
jgi:uncharacterized protein